MKQRFDSLTGTIERNRTLFATVALGGVALTGCASSADERFGNDFNEGTYTIAIDEGARVRDNPYVGTSPENDSLLFETNDPTLAIVDDGIYIVRTEDNGNWYGIPAEAVRTGIEDDDGVVWVNEQKAYIVEDAE